MVGFQQQIRADKGQDVKASDKLCTLLLTLNTKVGPIKKPGKLRDRGMVFGQRERLPPSVDLRGRVLVN